MDGFRWALKGGQPCLNLYLTSWTLDTSGKFCLALLFVFLLAISTEAISKYRHTLARRRDRVRWMQTCLHGIHAATGYILMLATMTYAVEMLVSVILGLVVGYVIFGGDSYSHVTTNPCCAFLEDEAQERVPRRIVGRLRNRFRGREEASTRPMTSESGTQEACCEDETRVESRPLLSDAQNVEEA